MTDQKRYVKYLMLLIILLAITSQDLYFYLKVNSWKEPISIHINPINGDGEKTTEQYINALRTEAIHNIALFLNKEATKYGISNKQIVTIQLGDEIKSKPPMLPGSDGNILSNIYWSIAFRIWSNWTQINSNTPGADINLYVVYFDPLKYSVVDYSVGLQKGMVGLINAYANATYQGSNNVIITHELLHILGATDKYYTHSNLPIFPTGFAEPDKSPLYPQTKAEIMGGRIPISPTYAIIPSNLEQVVIGKLTALEINWTSL